MVKSPIMLGFVELFLYPTLYPAARSTGPKFNTHGDNQRNPVSAKNSINAEIKAQLSVSLI